MGLFWLGVLGTLAMALGTAALSVSLALALVAGRDGLLRLARPLSGGVQLAAGLEALAGLVLVISALAVAVALG
jgi:nickel/cobalt transporter (NicO) family protein